MSHFYVRYKAAKRYVYVVFGNVNVDNEDVFFKTKYTYIDNIRMLLTSV